MPVGEVSAQTVRVTTYYHNNIQGSPFAASDTNGVLWTETYSPYGYRQGNEEGAKALNRVGFTGHVEEKYTENQLIYAKGRFYDPTVGRFISLDPVDFLESDPATFNRYAYANNNPYLYTDPSGELFFLAPVAIFIAKEIAAEGLSRATNGATDFLSVRRLATKGFKKGAQLLANRKSNSVLLDSNVITGLKKDPTLSGRIKANETPVISNVTKPELRNAVSSPDSNLKGLPKALDDLPVADLPSSLNTRINIRGQLPVRRGRFGDGIIGAQAIENKIPLVTNDKDLSKVVRSLGGSVR